MKNIQVFLSVLTVSLVGVNLAESKEQSFKPKPECTDANFWCQNLLTAKTCNAVDYCINAVWATHISAPSPSSNVVCDACKKWVAKARTALEDNDIEIVRELESICGYIPVKPLQDRCVDFASNDAANIIRMLESDMDPETVCSSLFLCRNHQIHDALAKKAPMKCGQCQMVGKLLEANFANPDLDFVLERLLGICGEMSSYSDSCITMVMTYFDDIYAFTRGHIRSQLICESSCKNQEKKSGIFDIQPALDDPSIPCNLCKEFFIHLSEVFLINTTEVEFRNILLGFCHEMGSFNKECIIIVDQYSDYIFKFMQNTLNADKTCTAVGICKSTDRLFQMPMRPLLLDYELFPLPKTVVEIKVNSLALEKNGTLCATCESFVHLIHEILEKQPFDDQILMEVKKVCKKLPEKVQPECMSMVDLYGDAILALWSQSMNPNLICPELRLCPPVLNLEYLSRTAVGEKPTCPFCLMAMQDIIDYIASNKTKSNVENALSRLCSHLNNKLLDQCEEFVKTYSNQIIDMVLANFTPQDACVFISLCEDKKDEEFLRIEDEPDLQLEPFEIVSNPQCDLCKEIIKIVEQRVINKKSKDEIRRELEKSCDRLKKFNKKCREFVDKYSDKIVDLIEQELEPEQVCHEMSFCVTSDKLEYQDYDFGLDMLMMAEKIDEPQESAMPQCAVCEFVISKIDEELSNQNLTDHYKRVIKNICSKMPQTISKECNQFIDYYYDMIIKLIELTKPSDMCAEMKLCPISDLVQTKIFEMIQNDLYKCAICRGIVETLDTVIEDPYTDANIENLEEKLCEKFAGKFKTKCHDIAKNYGLVIINLMKTITDSDEICYKLDFCDISGQEGTLKINDL